MNPWERWLRRPKSLWLRKAIFQVHLWTGIALGIYVFTISVSGSAVVFRNEVYNSAPSGPRLVPIGSHKLNHSELRDAAQRAYPSYKVTWIWDTARPKDAPNQAIEIWLARDGHKKQRLFDPYTGQDLGESRPYAIQLMAWLLDLHVNLLAGKNGRLVNGLGAIFVLGLSISGLVLWWPGVRSWRAALGIHANTNWKRFNWELHTVVGLWTLPLVLMFGLVGVYAGFPAPFQTFVNKIAPLDFYRPVPDASLQIQTPFVAAATPTPRRRFQPHYSTGDKIIRWFSYLHFGNFGGWVSKTIWTIIGLAPAFLFVTGFLMWWNRVVRPLARQRYNFRSWQRNSAHSSPLPD